MTAETARKYAWLERLSTEELEGLLHAQVFSADSEDLELTDLILEVIVKRKGDELPDPVKAMEDFNRLYRDLEEPLYPLDDTEEPLVGAGKSTPARPRMVRRVLIAAAVVAILVTMMTVPVLGYDSVFQMIGQWTAEQFGFRAVGTPSDEVGRGQHKEVPEEFAELQEALSEKGIDDFLFPIIPQDFHMVESNLYIDSDTSNVDFSILYENDLNSILFSVVHLPPSNTVYEKDDKEVVVYKRNGIDHYIFSNITNITVAWCAGELEYSISTDVSVSEAEKIIDLMYEE